MKNKEFYLVPVIVSGLVGAIPGTLCGCCAGLLTATVALLAVWLVRRRSGGLPIEAGEGALIGGLAGTVTAVVSTALALVLRYTLEQYSQSFQLQMGGGSFSDMSLSSAQGVGVVVGIVVSVVIHVGMGAGGGALATLILKTRGDASPRDPY